MNTADVVRLAPRDDAAAIEETAAFRRSGRSARTLVKAGRLVIELLALRRNAALAEHRVKGHVTIHVLRGALRVTTADGPADLASGDLLVLAPNTAHSVVARRDARVLLTLVLDR